MWYEETGNDIFNAGVNHDNFVSNLKCQVAIKTPWGSVSERIVLEKIEMQGTVRVTLKASVQLDILGKECLESNVEKETYLGNILSHDGKIDNNVQERQNKGIGYANQIMSTLQEISFGCYFFNMAMFGQNVHTGSSNILSGILHHRTQTPTP